MTVRECLIILLALDFVIDGLQDNSLDLTNTEGHILLVVEERQVLNHEFECRTGG